MCPNRTCNQILSTAIIGAILILGVRPLSGCPICSLMPAKTLADELIDSSLVVLATENPERRFSYLITDTLKGKIASRNVDLFVDSTTRRHLQAQPDHRVLLIRNNQGEWKSLAIANKQTQQIVRRILIHARNWVGKTGQTERARFFLELWGHENRLLFELAYLELAKAPYSVIKNAAKAISIEELKPVLNEVRYFHWRPLAILLLAQKPDTESRTLITRSFESSCRFSTTTNLAAWATAYVEVHGQAGIQKIQIEYLANKNRTRDEVFPILKSLSVLASSSTHPFDQELFRNAYQTLLETHPYCLPYVVDDLARLEAWEFRENAVKYLQSKSAELKKAESESLKRFILQATDPRHFP